MIRGMFALIPGIKNISENIQATCIVDKFLEHSRFFVFCAGGEEEYYLSSADWMTRNFDDRVETACPIYDKGIRQEIKDFLSAQWQDSVKARILNKDLDNQYKNTSSHERIRAQDAFYQYLKAKLDGSAVMDV